MEQRIDRVEELQLVLDHARQRVTRANCSVDLAGKSVFWDILAALAKRFDAYYSVAQLKHAIWDTYPISDGSVWSSVSELRPILLPLGIGIQCKKRLGYRLVDLGK